VPILESILGGGTKNTPGSAKAGGGSHSMADTKMPAHSSSSSSSSSTSKHVIFEAADRYRQITEFSDRYNHYVSALSSQSLRLVPVSGDGNCLFRAVAHQVYDNEDLHALVRAKCM